MNAAAARRTLGRVTAEVDGEVVRLAGDIDDQARLSDLVGPTGARVVIDLAGIRFINSIGVREWILFLGAMTERGTRVLLRNCSEPMVHQMSMVVEAKGAAEIESFCAPFLCDDCGGEQSLVIDVTAHRAELDAKQMPNRACPDCGGTLRFDDFPKRYLLFLEP